MEWQQASWIFKGYDWPNEVDVKVYEGVDKSCDGRCARVAVLGTSGRKKKDLTAIPLSP